MRRNSSRSCGEIQALLMIMTHGVRAAATLLASSTAALLWQR